MLMPYEKMGILYPRMGISYPRMGISFFVMNVFLDTVILSRCNYNT